MTLFLSLFITFLLMQTLIIPGLNNYDNLLAGFLNCISVISNISDPVSDQISLCKITH